MKRVLKILFWVLVVIVGYSAWQVFAPRVKLPAGKYFFIPTGSSFSQVKNALLDQQIISSDFYFDRLSSQLNYTRRVKPGRYEILHGMSLLDLVRRLKAGNQSPVRLVITKLRTKEELAGKIGRNFEVDSAVVQQFLTNNDSLKKLNLDTNNVMTIVIPNSYLFWWNSSLSSLLTRLKSEKDKFWEGERSRKAKALGLTNDQVYTMASIVEEETNAKADKGKIASTYLNRLRKGMKLEADPTVKYAIRDFGIKRVLRGHLQYPSKYNTYQNTGLPPGPICTPAINTIDAVLEAPVTDYLFFVAKPDLKGYSNFAASYPEHLKFADQYRRALDSLLIQRQQLTTP